MLKRLDEKGYGSELTITEEGAHLQDSQKKYRPQQLTILKTYRFEGVSDPADMSVVYAIRSEDGEKGFLLNAYGTYSDQDNPYYDEFIKAVPVDEIEDL